MTCSLKKFYRVYDDEDGSFVEIGPDSDDLGLIELRISHSGDSITEPLFTMHPDRAKLVGRALLCLEVKDEDT